MAIRSAPRWDLTVNDRNGQRVLIVEVKKKLGASPNWAAQYRRNILAHGVYPTAPYLLMAFPDRFYLWSGADNELPDSEPTYSIDATPMLVRYFEGAGVTAEEISGSSFELIISSWLGELMHFKTLSDTTKEKQDWLIESGLHAALIGGRFEDEEDM